MLFTQDELCLETRQSRSNAQPLSGPFLSLGVQSYVCLEFTELRPLWVFFYLIYKDGYYP